MKLNVHKLYLNDALDEIMIKFDECRKLGDNTLEIIHGYKHGTIIKDYIRSDGFIKDVARNGHEIESKNFSDKGVTVFQLKPSRIILNSRQKLKSESSRDTSENKVAPIFCIKCKEPIKFHFNDMVEFETYVVFFFGNIPENQRNSINIGIDALLHFISIIYPSNSDKIRNKFICYHRPT